MDRAIAFERAVTVKIAHMILGETAILIVGAVHDLKPLAVDFPAKLCGSHDNRAPITANQVISRPTIRTRQFDSEIMGKSRGSVFRERAAAVATDDFDNHLLTEPFDQQLVCELKRP